MDPINIFIGINLFLTISSNFSGAKKGIKQKISQVVSKPDTYLQKFPTTISAILVLLTILGVFKIGVFESFYSPDNQLYRVVGLFLFILFSWLQVWSFKLMGNSYSQDIVILKKHELVTRGIFQIIRHPIYLCQFFIDLSAALALGSYFILILAIIQIPLFIKRALIEDQILLKHFGDDFVEYKKSSGFMIPFIG